VEDHSSSTKRLGIDSSEHTLCERDAERVWLAALNVKKDSDEPVLLAKTTEIVLRGSGYATGDEATTAAHRWRMVLELAFARRNIQAEERFVAHLLSRELLDTVSAGRRLHTEPVLTTLGVLITLGHGPPERALGIGGSR
jgi:hypothetical protein